MEGLLVWDVRKQSGAALQRQDGHAHTDGRQRSHSPPTQATPDGEDPVRPGRNSDEKVNRQVGGGEIGGNYDQDCGIREQVLNSAMSEDDQVRSEESFWNVDQNTQFNEIPTAQLSKRQDVKSLTPPPGIRI
jgi:hypothetical protein